MPDSTTPGCVKTPANRWELLAQQAGTEVEVLATLNAFGISAGPPTLAAQHLGQLPLEQRVVIQLADGLNAEMRFLSIPDIMELCDFGPQEVRRVLATGRAELARLCGGNNDFMSAVHEAISVAVVMARTQQRGQRGFRDIERRRTTMAAAATRTQGGATSRGAQAVAGKQFIPTPAQILSALVGAPERERKRLEEVLSRTHQLDPDLALALYCTTGLDGSFEVRNIEAATARFNEFRTSPAVNASRVFDLQNRAMARLHRLGLDESIDIADVNRAVRGIAQCLQRNKTTLLTLVREHRSMTNAVNPLLPTPVVEDNPEAGAAPPSPNQDASVERVLVADASLMPSQILHFLLDGLPLPEALLPWVAIAERIGNTKSDRSFFDRCGMIDGTWTWRKVRDAVGIALKRDGETVQPNTMDMRQTSAVQDLRVVHPGLCVDWIRQTLPGLERAVRAARRRVDGTNWHVVVEGKVPPATSPVPVIHTATLQEEEGNGGHEDRLDAPAVSTGSASAALLAPADALGSLPSAPQPSGEEGRHDDTPAPVGSPVDADLPDPVPATNGRYGVDLDDLEDDLALNGYVRTNGATAPGVAEAVATPSLTLFHTLLTLQGFFDQLRGFNDADLRVVLGVLRKLDDDAVELIRCWLMEHGGQADTATLHELGTAQGIRPEVVPQLLESLLARL